jgi:hypothetical protein
MGRRHKCPHEPYPLPARLEVIHPPKPTRNTAATAAWRGFRRRLQRLSPPRLVRTPWRGRRTWSSAAWTGRQIRRQATAARRHQAAAARCHQAWSRRPRRPRPPWTRRPQRPRPPWTRRPRRPRPPWTRRPPREPGLERPTPSASRIHAVPPALRPSPPGMA